MNKKLQYYLHSSFRRKLLDKIQKKYVDEYYGFVLDIGGRDRGAFKKPKNKVDKWIFADIEEKHKPDLIIDVSNMQNIKSESIDVVNAIELFEHVEHPEQALFECLRILKYGGKMIVSVPFLYPVHADPFDFQRWTEYKWEKEFGKAGFTIQKKEISGRYFTVVNDMKLTFIKSLPPVLKHLGYICIPIFSLFNKLDNSKWLKNNKRLKHYHGGYFYILKKKN